MAPIRRQIAACALFITLPIWIVPGGIFAILFLVYLWIYEDLCGWKDQETSHQELLESKTLNDFRTIAILKAKVVELVEDAEEGWAYASPYFRDKWQWEDRAAKHQLFIKQFDEHFDVRETDFDVRETEANDS